MNSSANPIGAAPAPPGVTPNFDHHSESLVSKLIIAAVVWPSIAVPIVCIRMFTSGRVIKRWHADDFLILIALLFAIANSIICGIQTHNGVGIHMWEVLLVDFKRFMKLGTTGGSVTYNLSTLFIKTSILAFYLRFSTERAFRIATYAVMVVAIGYCLANGFVFLYMCQPIVFFWDPTVPGGGKCGDIYGGFLACAALNVVTDILILLMPIWLIWPLRVGLLKKLGVGVIMMTGGFVAAVSIVRMEAILHPGRGDTTWYYATNLSWCLHEMYTGIICACLPCLRPFTKHYFPDSFIFRANFEDSLRFYVSLPISLGGERKNRSAEGLQEKSDIETPVDSSITSDETPRDEGDMAGMREGRSMSAGFNHVNQSHLQRFDSMENPREAETGSSEHCCCDLVEQQV